MKNETRQKLFEDCWKDIKFYKDDLKEACNFFFNLGTLYEEDYIKFKRYTSLSDENEIDKEFLSKYISEENND